MKIFVSLPAEILSEPAVGDFWLNINPKIQKEFPNAEISSSYCGGSIEDSDAVIFLYEYKNTMQYKQDMELCRKLDKPYNFFLKL